MKLTINIDCTPAEARAFFGQPDLEPMNDMIVEEMKKRAKENMDTLADPERLVTLYTSEPDGDAYGQTSFGDYQDILAEADTHVTLEVERDDEFEPKLGKIRSRGSKRGRKYLHRVLQAVALAGGRVMDPPLRPVAGFGGGGVDHLHRLAALELVLAGDDDLCIRRHAAQDQPFGCIVDKIDRHETHGAVGFQDPQTKVAGRLQRSPGSPLQSR